VAVTCCAEEEAVTANLLQTDVLALLYSSSATTPWHSLVAELSPSSIPRQPTTIGLVHFAIV
jgi:hypothetical protein